MEGSAVQLLSTYLFQKDGGCGYIDKALCSTSSMTRFTTVTDTGDPMAVPKDCWLNVLGISGCTAGGGGRREA